MNPGVTWMASGRSSAGFEEWAKGGSQEGGSGRSEASPGWKYRGMGLCEEGATDGSQHGEGGSGELWATGDSHEGHSVGFGVPRGWKYSGLGLCEVWANGGSEGFGADASEL